MRETLGAGWVQTLLGFAAIVVTISVALWQGGVFDGGDGSGSETTVSQDQIEPIGEQERAREMSPSEKTEIDDNGAGNAGASGGEATDGGGGTAETDDNGAGGAGASGEGTTGGGTGTTSGSDGGTASAGASDSGTIDDDSETMNGGDGGTVSAGASDGGATGDGSETTSAGSGGADPEGGSEPDEAEQPESITRVSVRREDSGSTPTTTSRPSTCVDVSPIRDGELISRSGHDDVYVTKVVACKAFKRLILSPEVIDAYGHLSFDRVRSVTGDVFDKFSTSTLARRHGYEAIFHLRQIGEDEGERHLLDLPNEALVSAELDLDSVFVINETEFFIWEKGDDYSHAGELDEVLSQQGRR